MKKKYMFIIFPTIIVITLILAGVGIVFNKSENEKQQGITNVFDVAEDGSIAYVIFDGGSPTIYLRKSGKGEEQKILELDNQKTILDIDFSPDGESLAYIEGAKDVKESTATSIYLLDLQQKATFEAVSEKAIITDIEFDPGNADEIFYLQAGTFENYSPIASANPHDYDIHSYRISTDETKKHTNLSKYAMHSLEVSSTTDSVFVRMDDDLEAESAEDIFASHQRIFEIPLEEPEQMKAVTSAEKDVFDFALLPEEDGMIYQSISNPEEGGTFEYELYYYDMENKEEEQLTFLKEYTDNPVIDQKNNKVYFMVDKQFAQQESDFHLYSMDMDGKNVKNVGLGKGE
ncbi:hypothetical protein [Sediminibacillus massiliensis]|uniref:hypothetical protein n=1 Tax=Sediminibacillus massiliensis TaxID=1926277 RepID=UPI000988641A|nr:hypothetical protein [Sediminibacillus massiliensis]